MCFAPRPSAPGFKTGGGHDKKKKEKRSKMAMKPKAMKSKRRKKGGKYKEHCDRGDVYSFANPNEDWDGHTFHAQVWYHSLEDVHELWLKDYFDYVIDVRDLEDVTFDGTQLPGWETAHIPGSYPIALSCVDGSCGTLKLEDFLSSDVCLDSRVFVHCWVGVRANAAVEQLVKLGFTNLHAAGPEGSAGFIQWAANGWEVVENDTYDPKDIPSCAKQCL